MGLFGVEWGGGTRVTVGLPLIRMWLNTSVSEWGGGGHEKAAYEGCLYMEWSLK